MPSRKTIPLRMSPRLYDALRRWAEDDFRSVNGQIEWLCHEALRRAGRLPAEHGAERGSGGPSERDGPPAASDDGSDAS
jgi:hypothetical protein